MVQVMTKFKDTNCKHTLLLMQHNVNVTSCICSVHQLAYDYLGLHVHVLSSNINNRSQLRMLKLQKQF